MLGKEEFLELATAKYDKVKKSQEIKSFYDHEKTFDEIWTEYGREVLEKSISETPKDRRKKTCAVTERWKYPNYRDNKCRMDYKRYGEIGTGTFSPGPIESAHREVIQKRMKLSGQMWTKKGAQNMPTLRSTHLSGKWDKVLNLICQTKIAA